MKGEGERQRLKFVPIKEINLKLTFRDWLSNVGSFRFCCLMNMYDGGKIDSKGNFHGKGEFAIISIYGAFVQNKFNFFQLTRTFLALPLGHETESFFSGSRKWGWTNIALILFINNFNVDSINLCDYNSKAKKKSTHVLCPEIQFGFQYYKI